MQLGVGAPQYPGGRTVGQRWQCGVLPSLSPLQLGPNHAQPWRGISSPDSWGTISRVGGQSSLSNLVGRSWYFHSRHDFENILKGILLLVFLRAMKAWLENFITLLSAGKS